MKMKRTYGWLAVWLCGVAPMAEAAVPATIGSMYGTGVKVYAQHEAAATNFETERTYTLDYKVVTIDGTSYVYMHCSDDAVPGEDWGLQYRYWSESMAKTENNVTVKAATYATQTVTRTMPDPLRYITFFVNKEGYSETDFIVYDPTRHNSLKDGDETVPVVTSATLVQSDTEGQLTIEAEDAADVFYYVESTSGGTYASVVLTRRASLSGLPAAGEYTLTPVSMKSGRSGTPVVVTVQREVVTVEFVPTAETTWDAWGDTPNTTVTFEDDAEKGAVCVMTVNSATNWFGVKFTTLPDGLGADGRSFAYAHLIAKPSADGQNVWRQFGQGEGGSLNSLVVADVWQDLVFRVKDDGSKQPITEISLQLDRRDGLPSRQLTMQKIVFNNDPTPLLPPPTDTEAPTLTTVTVDDGSLTFSQVRLQVDGTDNFGLASYEVSDEANGLNRSIAVSGTPETITLNGLTPSTSYHLAVQAKDQAGNLSETVFVDVTTLDRDITPRTGVLTEKGGDEASQVNYEILYTADGKLTYVLKPAGGKTLSYGQVHVMNPEGGFGFTDMTKQDDGTYQLSPVYVYPSDLPVYVMFVWNYEDHVGNWTSAANDDLDNYFYFRSRDCVERPLADDETFAAETPVTVASACYTRTFAASGAYSIVLPFRASLPEGVTAQAFVGGKNGVVRFAETDGLEAGTPYILRVASAGTYAFMAEPEDGLVSVQAASEVLTVQGDVEAGQEYEFVGNYTPKADLPGVYFLNADGTGFVKTASGASIGSYRAYIRAKAGGAAPMRLAIDREDGPTSIRTGQTAALPECRVQDGRLEVRAARAQTICVTSVDGRTVSTFRLEAGESRTLCLPAGLYLVGKQKVVLY